MPPAGAGPTRESAEQAAELAAHLSPFHCQVRTHGRLSLDKKQNWRGSAAGLEVPGGHSRLSHAVNERDAPRDIHQQVTHAGTHRLEGITLGSEPRCVSPGPSGCVCGGTAGDELGYLLRYVRCRL